MKVPAELKTQLQERDEKWFESLDAGIRPFVKILVDCGIETYQSCEGGDGHSFPEPTIQFHGEHAQGFSALAIAFAHNMPVKRLCRTWGIQDLEPVGPHWELVFWRVANDMETSI